MNIKNRLKNLEQKIIHSPIDCVDIHFIDTGKVTGTTRLWINSNRPNEEFTPEGYEKVKATKEVNFGLQKYNTTRKTN